MSKDNMFIGEDLFANRELNDDEIASAISGVYGIPSNRVYVLHESNDWVSNPAPLQPFFVCSVFELGRGEFQTHMRTHPLSAYMKAVPDYDRLEFLGRLAELWGCYILIGREDVHHNPFKYILVRARNDHQNVTVDPDLFFDEQNRGVSIKEYE